MFNKATAKLPPRIEKWVMDMQDVGFELVYEPGKDDAYPMDYLSRHPLPITGTDNTEKIVKSVLTTEHDVAIDRIGKEMQETYNYRSSIRKLSKKTDRNTEKMMTLSYFSASGMSSLS